VRVVGRGALLDPGDRGEHAAIVPDEGSAMSHGARRRVVLKVKEPSVGVIQLGKITTRFHDQRWCYVNNISAEMRKTGEFAVAPCVAELMREWQVMVVMYYDERTKTTFVTNLDTLISEGHLVGYSYRPQYWHLPISRWMEVGHKVGTVWTTDTLALEWTNLAEAQVLQPRQERAKQLAMF